MKKDIKKHKKWRRFFLKIKKSKENRGEKNEGKKEGIFKKKGRLRNDDH